MNWIFFIARRFFATRRKEKGHVASILSVAGILVGVMTLNVVLGIMNGFQNNSIQNILELSSYHIQLENPDAGMESYLRDHPDVASVTTFQEIQALISGRYQDPEPCIIRGVPENIIELDKGLAAQLALEDGRFDISSPGKVVIGSILASSLGARVGQNIDLITIGEFSSTKPQTVSFEVAGIFKSGYHSIDASWVFTSFRQNASIFPGTNVLGIKMNDRYQEKAVISDFYALYPDSKLISWREFNRSIFGALQMEKNLMMLVISLIFVVVGFNIFQNLNRSVIERADDIGVLRGLGAPGFGIQAVFISEGIMIGFLGAVLGTMAGLFLNGNINETFEFVEIVSNTVIGALNSVFDMGLAPVSIFSPRYFYIDEIPSIVYFSEVFTIFLFALFSAVVAAFVASRRVAYIKPNEVLRYEL